MGKNLLDDGAARIGWMIDGDAGTPDISVMLQNVDRKILLTVPTKGSWFSGPYECWFSEGIRFGDDPERTRHKYSPPRSLLFHDSDGPVVLVGCRAFGSTWSSGSGAGHGRIVANFAILGGRQLRYEKINGLRSELPALRLWTGIRSVKEEFKTDGHNRVTSLTLEAESPPPVPIDRSMNLSFRPAWRTSRPDNAAAIAAHDAVEVSTFRNRAADWDDHLRKHLAIRNLIALSAWQPFGFSRLCVNQKDDPERVLSGEAIGPRWALVVTHRVQPHEPWKKDPRFLFRLPDIGVSGIRNWLKVQHHFRRAIQPLIGILDVKAPFIEQQVVQSGIAIEALGYQLEMDRNGTRFDKRGQLSYLNSIDSILDDMPYVPIQDTADWKSRSRDCYMGAKHPDRTVPDSLVLFNTHRENLLILRYWLAARLGCSVDLLRSQLAGDPHSQEFVEAG